MHPYRGAQVAQAIARALSEAIAAQGLGANELAKRSGVNRQVIANVLAGTTWPDLITIANLETALGATLWPDHNAWDNTAPVPSPPLPRKPRDPAS
jgi:transcriptional regulator with XRE-family HTH domain